ncbi:MAG: helix-turn-helix domain-containing protein [Candidatus Paceibacterota bacterium]
MAIDLAILKQFGLRRNDRKVYEALVGLGKAKSGPLMTKAGVGSSSLYAALETLIARGLISYEVRNNIRFYKPEKVDTLISQSRETTRTLLALEEQLRALTPTVAERNETNVFEGHHGFERAFYEHVARMKTGEELRIIGFGASTPERHTLARFLAEINQIAARKKCRIRILLDETFRNSIPIAPIASKQSVHYLHSTYFGPTAYNISKTEVLLSAWGEEALVVRIRNPILVASFAAHFDSLIEVSAGAVTRYSGRSRQ